jgi:hypothetical protein
VRQTDNRPFVSETDSYSNLLEVISKVVAHALTLRMYRRLHALLVCFLGVCLCGANARESETDALQLWKIQKHLASKRYVDLTHEFAPGIPHWPGFPRGNTKDDLLV